MWVFVCVWLFKRFLQGREGREDNGSRHYLLLSCWLSIMAHTMWPSQTRMPSGCTCTHSPSQRMHVPNTLTHAHTHTGLCRDDLHACRASYVDTEKEITHLRVLTPTLNEHSFLLAKREHTETGLAGFTYSRPALFQGRRLMDCLKQEYRTKDFTSCRPDYALCVFSGVHHRVCICAAVHAFLALCRC